MPTLTKLPPEVLTEIFEYVAYEDEASGGEKGGTTPRQVFCTLARTCRAWSGPAVGELYAHLAFEFPRPRTRPRR